MNKKHTNKSYSHKRSSFTFNDLRVRRNAIDSVPSSIRNRPGPSPARSMHPTPALGLRVLFSFFIAMIVVVDFDFLMWNTRARSHAGWSLGGMPLHGVSEKAQQGRFFVRRSTYTVWVSEVWRSLSTALRRVCASRKTRICSCCAVVPVRRGWSSMVENRCWRDRTPFLVDLHFILYFHDIVYCK